MLRVGQSNGERQETFWRHPAGRRYVRKYINGKMMYLGRIRADEGTSEFDRQYWEIVSGKKVAAKTFWSALTNAMRERDMWSIFSPRYRKDLEPVFE